MKRPEELLLVKFESENAVVPGGSNIEAAFEDAHLVGVLQIGIAPRPDEFEIRRKSKEHFTRCHINSLAVDGDATQATVPITSWPVGVGRDKVHNLAPVLLFHINDMDAAMAFVLVTAADD